MRLADFADPVLLAIGFAAGLIAAGLLIGVIGRGPFNRLARLGVVLRAPFRPLVYVLRQLRILPKGAAKVRAGPATLSTAADSLRRRFMLKTETELALMLPDEAGTEDFVDLDEEERLLRRDGFVFNSIQIPAEYYPDNLSGQLEDGIADDYLEAARRFFSDPVDLEAEDDALYEDCEGAVLVARFRRHDRRCYFLLNEMRKLINGNARRLVILFSVLTGAALIASAAVVRVVPAPDGAIAAGVVNFAAILSMFVWHSTGYQKQQQHNSRELRAFLTRYLGRISDRYRDVKANARGVTVGDETDSKKLAEDATRWHKILMWLPLRTYAIESFVRIVMYQINRNTRYYEYMVPAFLVLVAIAAVATFAYGAWSLEAAFTPYHGFYALTVALMLAIYVQRILAVVVADELSALDWLGYDNLDVSDGMDEVVGKYAEDVGFWKRRLDR